MLTAACAAFLLGQIGGAEDNPFAAPQSVVEPDRIAMTPKLDGSIEPEEWDPFATSGGVPVFFEWEPDRIHAGAAMAAGQELVVSLDRKGDGWLVGKDNLELRLAWQDGKPVLRARWLDATDPAGPKWVAAPEIEQAAIYAGSIAGEKWSAELTAIDPGIGFLPHFPDTKFAVRVDAVAGKGEDGLAPFLPRAATAVEAEMTRGTSVPGGLRWGNEVGWYSLGPGAKWNARVTFNGSNEMKLQKIDMRVAGVGSGDFATMSSPFPAFDNKGRAFVDFMTPVPKNATPGYRNLLAAVSDASGQQASFRVAFRILPQLYFDPVIPATRNTENGVRVRLPIHAMNRSDERLRGNYSVVLPEGWKSEEGGDKNMTLKGFNSDARRVLQVSVPAGAKGAYPLTFIFDMGDRKIQQTEWIWIDEPKKK